MGWRCRCSEQRCLRSTFSTTRVAGAVREGGQIDVRADPGFVSRVVWNGGENDRQAELAIDKNKSAKKSESQRQREKNAKVWMRCVCDVGDEGGGAQTADGRGGRGCERVREEDLRCAERGGNRPRSDRGAVRGRGRTITRRRRRWRTW